MKRKHFILFGILGILVFNLFLTYGLMWNPYSLYFDRPEFSETHFTTRDNYALIVTIANFILLWGTLIWAIIVWYKKSKFSFIAPIISVLTFWLIMEVQDYYANMNSTWTENGYQYKVQKWYLDGDNIYKRWKSQDSLKSYDNHREIVWELDSMKKE